MTARHIGISYSDDFVKFFHWPIVMNYSGATGTLGLALAATGAAFPFFQPVSRVVSELCSPAPTPQQMLYFRSLQGIVPSRLGFSRSSFASANSAGG